jgi:preprotein translocase subunit YajC
MSFVPIGAMVLIFYFLVLRPQQRQAKDHQKMLENLKKGDRVLTTGGVYGVIAGFRGSDLELKIAENTKVLVSRASVSRLANDAQANNSVVAETVAS